MPASHTPQRRIQWGILLLLILLASGLRLARLPLVAMWSDEYHSFRVSALPLSEIVQGNYGDYNPPLYFALLRLQRGLFGDSEIALRSPSLLFALLSLPLFYLLARSILKAFVPSLAALALVAFHPMLIYYSVEIRSYSLLLLCSVLSYLSVVKIQDESARPVAWATLLALGMSGCVYTHHFGIIVPLSILAFIGVKSLLLRRWTRREALSALSVGIAALLYLPGLSIVQRKALAVPEGGNVTPLTQSLQVFVASIDHPPYEGLLAALALVALVAGTLGLLAQSRESPAALLAPCGILTAAAFTALAHLAGINTASRYLILILPLVAIAIAATLIPRAGSWFRLVNWFGAVTVAIYAVYGIHFVLNTPRENQQASWKADWKQLSAVVSSLRAADESVIIKGWDATPVQYYLGDHTLTRVSFEDQLRLHAHPSYLIIMTPMAQSIPAMESATLLYEDKDEGLRILRLRAPP